MLNHDVVQFGKWMGTPDNVTDLQKTMDVNFYAYIMTASHALPALKKSRGSIIVLDSNMGKSSIFYAEQENWSLCNYYFMVNMANFCSYGAESMCCKIIVLYKFHYFFVKCFPVLVI